MTNFYLYHTGTKNCRIRQNFDFETDRICRFFGWGYGSDTATNKKGQFSALF